MKMNLNYIQAFKLMKLYWVILIVHENGIKSFKFMKFDGNNKQYSIKSN